MCVWNKVSQDPSGDSEVYLKKTHETQNTMGENCSKPVNSNSELALSVSDWLRVFYFGNFLSKFWLGLQVQCVYRCTGGDKWVEGPGQVVESWFPTAFLSLHWSYKLLAGSNDLITASYQRQRGNWDLYLVIWCCADTGAGQHTWERRLTGHQNTRWSFKAPIHRPMQMVN